jgi:anti-sigma-K factor RskA
MNFDLSHAEIETLLGAYALDAVSPEEAEAIGAHLQGCPRCRSEVAEHREVAALLANAGGPAPADVWDRIRAQLEETPPALALAPVVPSRRVRPLVTWAAAAAAAAAVAVAAVIIGVLGAQVSRLDRRVAALQRPLQSFGVQQAALAAVVNPQARRVELHSDRSADAVDVVFLPDGQAYVLQSALPALGAGQTYQLWGLVGGRTKVSLGLLGPQPTTTAFRLDPSRVSLLAVTAEPAGGVATTDKPAVAWAKVPAVS